MYIVTKYHLSIHPQNISVLFANLQTFSLAWFPLQWSRHVSYLPDVLLEQGVDDDPDKGVEDNVQGIQYTMFIEGLRERPGVHTKTSRV